VGGGLMRENSDEGATAAAAAAGRREGERDRARLGPPFDDDTRLRGFWV
jgi:hypothetical protein